MVDKAVLVNAEIMAVAFTEAKYQLEDLDSDARWVCTLTNAYNFVLQRLSEGRTLDATAKEMREMFEAAVDELKRSRRRGWRLLG